MARAFSIACFIVGALAFLIGFVTEFRQSRRVGPYAIVPTLPWAVAAAIFVVFGLWFVPYNIPWWSLPLAFMGAVVVLGYGIALAPRDSSQND